DFGVAKLTSEDQFLTREGSLVGSPDYASPEQIKALELDERSDIYSVGCLMYETLSGQLPFEGREGVFARLSEDVPLLTDRSEKEIPGWLEDIVLNCMAREKEDRYSSIEELKKELLKVGGVAQEEKAPAIDSPDQSGKFKPALTIAVAAILII